LAHPRQDVQVTAQLVRRPAAGCDDPSQVIRGKVANMTIHHRGIAMLPTIRGLANSGELGLETCLLESQLRVPDLQVLVLRPDENQNRLWCFRHATSSNAYSPSDAFSGTSTGRPAL